MGLFKKRKSQFEENPSDEKVDMLQINKVAEQFNKDLSSRKENEKKKKSIEEKNKFYQAVDDSLTFMQPPGGFSTDSRSSRGRSEFSSYDSDFSRNDSVFSTDSKTLKRGRQNGSSGSRKQKKKDSWSEIPLQNKLLFPSLSLPNLPELLPGHLFTTKSDQNILSTKDFTKWMKKKLRKSDIHTVFALVENKEDEAIIKAFYESFNVNCMTRTIGDINEQNVVELNDIITHLTNIVSFKHNVLIHSSGDSDLVGIGMLLCGMLKNAGLDDPIEYVNEINEDYLPTPEHESIALNMTITIKKELTREYPNLAKAVALDRLVKALSVNDDASPAVELSESQIFAYRQSFEEICGDMQENLKEEISEAEFKRVVRYFNVKQRKLVLSKVLKPKSITKKGKTIDFDHLTKCLAVGM